MLEVFMLRVFAVAALTFALSTCGSQPTTGTGGGGGSDVDAGTGGGTATGGGGGAVVDAGTGGGGGAVVDAGTGGGGGSMTVDAGPADAGTVVRFVATGDTGKGNAGQNQVGAAIGAHCAQYGCDFVTLLGDNFYPSGVTSTTDPQWQTAFVQPYAPVNAPFYPVLGNHDYGADGAGTDLTLGQHQVDYSAVNPKWRLPAVHHKFRMKHVEFFVSDTNRSMFSVDSAVKSDFDQWLPASTATWKIAMGHHPYKSNGPHGNAGSYDGLPFVPIANGAGVKSFLEGRVCGRADFYLSGHDHSIQWLQATCTRSGSSINTGLIVSGGGAATTDLPGTQPTYYQSKDLGFVYIVIRDNTFTATFYDANGVEKYTRTVTK